MKITRAWRMAIGIAAVALFAESLYVLGLLFNGVGRTFRGRLIFEF